MRQKRLMGLPEEKQEPTKAHRVTIGSGGPVSTGTLVRDTQTPELVIALCGPIGTPLQDVAEVLAEILSNVYGYTCRTIRLSKKIETHAGRSPGTAFERIVHLIDKRNELRRAHGASILADLAIHEPSIANRQRQRPLPSATRAGESATSSTRSKMSRSFVVRKLPRALIEKAEEAHG